MSPPHVRTQVAGLRERPIAHATDVRLLTRMAATLMQFQSAGARKRIFARLTDM